MSLRLDPRVRLRARGQFTAVQTKGRRVGTSFMTLLALPNALDRDRLGVIASRKLGGAVVRNRAKRRLRAIFREIQPDLARERGHVALDIVVIRRRELVQAPFGVLQGEFGRALGRFDRTRRS